MLVKIIDAFIMDNNRNLIARYDNDILKNQLRDILNERKPKGYKPMGMEMLFLPVRWEKDKIYIPIYGIFLNRNEIIVKLETENETEYFLHLLADKKIRDFYKKMFVKEIEVNGDIEVELKDPMELKDYIAFFYKKQMIFIDFGNGELESAKVYIYKAPTPLEFLKFLREKLEKDFNRNFFPFVHIVIPEGEEKLKKELNRVISVLEKGNVVVKGVILKRDSKTFKKLTQGISRTPKEFRKRKVTSNHKHYKLEELVLIKKAFKPLLKVLREEER